MAMAAGSGQPRVTPYGALDYPPRGIPARFRARVRNGVRRYGQLTAGRRAGPDYLIIGTKRGGTTSLANWLLEHPDVRPLFPARETRKGTYFFDVNYERGWRWYRSHFPSRRSLARAADSNGRRPLVGEATPYYLHHPHAARRARRVAPDARVIVLLRHPVERAHSHWMERVRNRIEPLEFADAIDAETGRLAGEEQRMLDDPSYVSFAHQHYAYVDQGRYTRGLRRWLDAYPPSRILVLRSEDLYDDPASVYRQVIEFLDLRPHQPEAFDVWNRKPKPVIDAALHEKLRLELEADIVELESFLGRSMGWD